MDGEWKLGSCSLITLLNNYFQSLPTVLQNLHGLLNQMVLLIT